MHNQYKSIKQALLKLFVATSIEQLAAEIKDGIVFINNKMPIFKC